MHTPGCRLQRRNPVSAPSGRRKNRPGCRAGAWSRGLSPGLRGQDDEARWRSGGVLRVPWNSRGRRARGCRAAVPSVRRPWSSPPPARWPMADQPQFDPAQYKKTTTQQWDAAAKAWDDWSPTLHEWLGPATEIMFDMAGIRAGSHVLDVAAGAGEQ